MGNEKEEEVLKRRGIVSFKDKTRTTPSLVQGPLKKAKANGLEAIFPFSVDKIMIAEWVNLKCCYGCNRYNTNWCCPPATPGIERVRTVLGEYSIALLLVGSQTCPDFYRNNARKRANQIRYWKGTLSLERMLFLEGYYKAFSLVGETCALCKECAYPKACLFPQEKRPCVESFFIDVIGTLQNLGTTSKVATHRNESFSYYGIILVE